MKNDMSAMTKDEILNSEYMGAKELKILMPQIGINGCRDIIIQVRDIMKSKNQFCPQGRTFIALTSEVKKFLGIRG